MWDYTWEGCAFWTPFKLRNYIFDPIHSVTRYGRDGRKERGVVNSLVKKGVIAPTDEKRIYRFTELGIKWLMWYRHANHGYPLPPEYAVTELVSAVN